MKYPTPMQVALPVPSNLYYFDEKLESWNNPIGLVLRANVLFIVTLEGFALCVSNGETRIMYGIDHGGYIEPVVRGGAEIR